MYAILKNSQNGTEYKYQNPFVAAKRALATGRSNYNGWILKDDLGINYPDNEWPDMARLAMDSPVQEKKRIKLEDIFFKMEPLNRYEVLKDLWAHGENPEDYEFYLISVVNHGQIKMAKNVKTGEWEPCHSGYHYDLSKFTGSRSWSSDLKTVLLWHIR